MKTFRSFLFTTLAILIFPVMDAQDITGDWYGIRQAADSLHITIHIYRDHKGLKATLDSPDQGAAFGIPMDETTLVGDTLSFRIIAGDINYKGHVNQNYSRLDGHLTQYGSIHELDFGRTKLMRTIPVNANSSNVPPAKAWVKKTRIPKWITYSGARVMEAQDITGDWYGLHVSQDSLRIALHIYRDHEGLKATFNSTDQDFFDYPVDEIIFENDTLCYWIETYHISYKGFVNKDFSKIIGYVFQLSAINQLNFGRTKINRIIPVNQSSLTSLPEIVKVKKTGNPQSINYSGIRVVKAGIPRVIKIDKSGLKIKTPGKNNILKSFVYQLPEPDIKSGYNVQNDKIIWVPQIVRAKQSEPVPAQSMRMKDAACLNIQYLNMEQGLIDQVIWNMMEDKRGNMWFASYHGGICRYDGKSFTYYTKKEGLFGNIVWSIIEDRNGNIWIGTDEGLCEYDGKSFIQFVVWRLFPGFLSILETRNGIIWFGTAEEGVLEKKGSSWTQYTEKEGLISNRVTCILEDKNGNMWFGTEQGVCKYNGVSFTHFTHKVGLISNRVTSMIEDRNGNLWFGTEKGVSEYNGKSFRQFTVNEGLSNNYVTSIKEDHSGNFWFGTWGGGVDMYNGNMFTHYTTGEGLTADVVLSVMEDKCRNIWLTTWGGGVMKLQRNSFTYFTQLEGIGKGNISSLIEDRHGDIWFGTFGAGLIKYDGKSFRAWTENEGLNDNTIRSISEDKYGNIWFTDNSPGLQKFDGKSVTSYNDKEIWNSVYNECIYEDNKGNSWLGSWGEGIKRFDGKSFTSYRGKLYPLNITSILKGNEGYLWFGSNDKGLFKYDGECFSQYTIQDGLSGIWVTSLFQDKPGNLWIGTKYGGIDKYDGKSFTHFTEKEGLSNNRVSSVIGDKNGNIWVGTKKGLSKLVPKGDGNYSITSFGAEDGLKDINFNEKSVCIDSRNHLWWGTGDIITMLDLNSPEIKPEPPVIQLNNIYINDKYIDFGALLSKVNKTGYSSYDTSRRMNIRGLKFSDETPFYNYPVDLELSHTLNHLTFNFSAIDWSAPQSIRYQYILEGLDEQWSSLQKANIADYRNIPPGKYIFKVKALSKGNAWSETFEYPFTILRPWWFRWWAYTLYGLVLILLARYYIRFILSRERIKAKMQIKQVEVDKMQELDRMKSRFFANISHEFRTPLTLILGPVNDLLKNRDRLREDDRKLLGIMKRNARRLQQLINQLLDLSKLENGNLELEVSEGNLTGFIRTIVLSFLSLAESKRISYTYDLQEMPAPCFYDEDKIEKIIMNLVSNALKFTPEGGSVMVTLRYSGEKDVATGLHAEIRVKDTGQGIPEDEKEKIFDRFYQVSSSDSREHEGSGIGLALTRELVQLYRGEIHVESEAGKGSTFTVMLPVSREHFREGEIVAVSEKLSGTKFSDGHESLVQEAAESDVQKDAAGGKDKDNPVILIVEDNTDLRKYISRNLLSFYQMLEAENGKEGLKKAIESIPDLVISDLMMPEMDGVELCKRLKTDTRTNHIPLIMLTAKADRDSKLESLETGADDYIIKPFDAEELRVRVKNLIEQRKKLRERYRKEFLTDPAEHEIPPPGDEFLVRLINCTKKHLKDPEFNVEQLGKELYLSRTQLYRKVLSLTDYTPNEFIRNIRLKMAARMFQEGHKNITSVLYTVGYSTPSHFTESFRELFGMNPSEYIKLKAKSTK